MNANRKVAIIGGGGVRTPLVIYGLNESAERIGLAEVCLFDLDRRRAELMAELGKAVVARDKGLIRLRVANSIEDAIDGADFIFSSIRVGGIHSRAADEQLAIRHQYPGQETTGPAGFAMALRTIPVALHHARLVKQYAPDSWYVNFTNPAGLITQAISTHSAIRAVGICDTPTELFHRIALALGAAPEDVRCEYLGLNHLGWVRKVFLRGQDVTAALLADSTVLRSLYSADLFDPELIRAIGLIPTEYLYFYYSRRRALANQNAAGATRGEEIVNLNENLFHELEHLASNDGVAALCAYTTYLNRRSGSYMKLEANAGSAYDPVERPDEDPFCAATGYHRIALDVVNALTSSEAKRVVVNIRNAGAIADLPASDIVEVPCSIGNGSIVPEPCGSLPDSVRGLVLAMKAYEHATIAAAVDSAPHMAQAALLLNPSVGEWEPAGDLLDDFLRNDRDLEYLREKVPSK